MCTVCGCSGDGSKIEGTVEGERGWHVHADGTAHSHAGSHYGITHPRVGRHHHRENLHYGLGPARAHVAGMSQSRMIRVEQDILAKNDAYAENNRCYFREHGMLALNLVSSPGSGKTTLLVHTVNAWRNRHPVSVIEGDQQTSLDADRIRATGIPAIQINTGRGCHLDAQMVGHALDRLHPADNSLLLIENVGNLVCPAAFDLGEAHKVAILSVTEGEDKPLKYPDMFAAANLMLLNKADLLPHLDFDVALAIEYARRVNPDIRVIVTSVRSGEGMEEWLTWLDEQMARVSVKRDASAGELTEI